MSCFTNEGNTSLGSFVEFYDFLNFSRFYVFLYMLKRIANGKLNVGFFIYFCSIIYVVIQSYEQILNVQWLLYPTFKN